MPDKPNYTRGLWETTDFAVPREGPQPGGAIWSPKGAYIGDFRDRADVERAVSCVNAMAGIGNPEKVRELIEALQETQVHIATDSRLMDALAALELSEE
ncbi:MAG TPA: hypothetical protein ENI27_06465 [bacterium]|nr:hypothetical protein [bacterium]